MRGTVFLVEPETSLDETSGIAFVGIRLAGPAPGELRPSGPAVGAAVMEGAGFAWIPDPGSLPGETTGITGVLAAALMATDDETPAAPSPPVGRPLAPGFEPADPGEASMAAAGAMGRAASGQQQIRTLTAETAHEDVEGNQPPIILGGATREVSVAEHSGGVFLLPVAADPEHDLLTWRITGGADAARFLMDPATGALRFLSAPDFERPGDAGGDNLYEVAIQAKDAWGATASQRLLVRVTDAEEVRRGTEAGDLLDGTGGTDTLAGLAGGDTLRGLAEDDRLLGGTGSDRLIGGAGNDSLAGGGGADTLAGGEGRDRLLGGSGADLFLFDSAAAGPDRVVGYRGAEDSLAVLGAAFGIAPGTDLLAAGLYVENESGRATSAPGTGQFILETGTMRLRWDADGAGGAPAVVIAMLAGATGWSAAEMVVL
jgi:hypothetical protein